ncbi:hypothetical protein BCEP27_80244 [Burkholderia cepacia]
MLQYLARRVSPPEHVAGRVCRHGSGRCVFAESRRVVQLQRQRVGMVRRSVPDAVVVERGKGPEPSGARGAGAHAERRLVSVSSRLLLSLPHRRPDRPAAGYVDRTHGLPDCVRCRARMTGGVPAERPGVLEWPGGLHAATVANRSWHAGYVPVRRDVEPCGWRGDAWKAGAVCRATSRDVAPAPFRQACEK